MFCYQGTVGGRGWVSANGDGVIPFCEPENEVLYKILQTFLRCRVFWCSLFSFLQRKQH